MCKNKKVMIKDVFVPKSLNSPLSTPRRKSSHSFDPSTTSSSYNFNDSSYTSSLSTATSISRLRYSLNNSNAGHIYDFSEIRSATNNFLIKSYSSSSTSVSWRCNLENHDVIVFQRKFRRSIDSSDLQEKLSLICKSHYTSLVKLRGASVSGNYVYLVYDFVPGANLADCLRNPRNPNFTVLSNWMSRIRIATDIAHGLDYIHNSTGLSISFVHNHIKSTSIIVTEPSLNAKICHFGTAELCGEITKEEQVSTSKNYTRTESRLLRVEGTRGYMSPEFQSVGIPTRRSDVYAFGVVILELLSGQQPLKYIFGDDGGGSYVKVSLIETAREAMENDGIGLRRWIDNRLNDSYPVEVAEKLTRVALECVEDDPEKRPDMGSASGRISKMYLESESWADKMGVLTDFTVSLAPR